jgi:uncharacterized protein YaeQ
MAFDSTVYKAELQISDMDRHYYATHALTVARHPSETEERLMVRLLAFAMLADDRLGFAKDLDSDYEPGLWRKEMNGEIGQWVELGQPDEQRVRRACSRSHQVTVINYDGRVADLWWEKNQSSLLRLKNLTVINIAPETTEALANWAARSMRIQCLVQDGLMQWLNDADAITVEYDVRMSPPSTQRWAA